jgi:hypothetical protein
MTFVPYPGNAPALNAVLGQQVTSMFATLSNVSEYLKVGKLRAPAVGNRSRAEPLPDVPTVMELGYGDFDIDAWFGAFAPAATPRPAIHEVENVFTAALRDGAVKEKLSVQGLFPEPGLRRGFRGVSAQAKRCVQPHYRASQYQGRVEASQRGEQKVAQFAGHLTVIRIEKPQIYALFSVLFKLLLDP